MTWPLPDRPKLPPPVDREQRDRQQQARLDAIEADDETQLPRGVRRREDGSWYTPFWRRDDVWFIGGAILSVVLLVGFLAYWTDGFTSGGSDESATAPVYIEHGRLTPFWLGVAIVSIFAVVAFIAGAIWVLTDLFRDTSVRYEDVSADEQARRREVARLLKQVEPPVTIEEAQRQLGHPPRDGGGP